MIVGSILPSISTKGYVENYEKCLWDYSCLFFTTHFSVTKLRQIFLELPRYSPRILQGGVFQKDVQRLNTNPIFKFCKLRWRTQYGRLHNGRKMQTPFIIYETRNIEVFDYVFSIMFFRFWRKQLEIQDCWLKVANSHICIFDHFDGNHIEPVLRPGIIYFIFPNGTQRYC